MLASCGSEPIAVGYSRIVRAHQRHAARGLGEPLVPADADAERAEARLPDAEAGVAGREVELLVVARALRDVRLAVDAEHLAVGVDHRQRVEVGVVGALEHAERQHHAELARQRLEAPHDRVVRRSAAPASKWLARWSLQKYGVSKSSCRRMTCAPLRGGLAHQRLGPGEVLGSIRRAGELGRGNGDFHRGLRGVKSGESSEAVAADQSAHEYACSGSGALAISRACLRHVPRDHAFLVGRHHVGRARAARSSQMRGPAASFGGASSSTPSHAASAADARANLRPGSRRCRP